MAKKKMTDSMKSNIENYANEIVTLEDDVAAIRQNIGMWIGRKGDPGFINMVREIFQNSADEINKKKSPATRATLSYNEQTLQTTVADNGRGIPFNNMERVFSDTNTGSNYQKELGEYSSGMHGVGAKVTNALSSFFAVDSYIFGKHRRIEFTDGHVSKPEYEDNTDVPENAQGTTVTFIPSTEVLGNITVTCEDIIALIERLLPMTKIGAIIDFYGTKMDGTVIERHYVNERGMIGALEDSSIEPLINPIYIFKDNGEIKLECYFTYDSVDLENTSIISYANFCPTSGGTHVKGFIDGVCKYFRTYMNKIFLSKNKKNLTVVNQDILCGLKAVIHTCNLHAIFTGQAKEELGNEETYGFVMNAVMEELDKWANTNSRELQKLCKCFKEIAEIRVNSGKERAKLVKKQNADALTGMPKKYVPANGRKSDGLELWISEGDSAKGSMTNSRNSKTQALFPVRGKTKNPFVSIPSKLLDNEEIANIVAICGGTYGRNFDISKCPFEKIILATDRDPDGSHILINLSAMFLILMPQIVELGMLYKALPPLYSVTKGKKKIYFGSRFEYIEYLQDVFSSSNTLILDGKQMSSKEINSMLYNNIDYMYDLDKLSKNYALNPRFLESVIKHMDLPFDQLQTFLKNTYDRTIEISQSGNNVVIQGLVFNRFQTLLINDRFYQEAKYIQNKYLYDPNASYVLNGQTIPWLYDIMDTFDKSTNMAVTRYKGLGEMNPKELFETTMDPETRTLIRYTTEDIKRDLKKLREYNSDEGRKRLIKDCVATRSDLLG